MSALKRLCFVLPLDSEEFHLSGKHKKTSKKIPDISKIKQKRNVSSYPRRAFRWFCGHCQLCSCVDHHGDSFRFEDIAGTDDSPNKKVGDCNPRIFSYSELYIGTNGFSEKKVLGSGGFGRVYHAVLPSDGTSVAVKRVAGQGDRFEKAFMAELTAVAQLRHRNLVRLRGWCMHEDDLLLVYDYMPNLSLDRLLFTSATSSTPPIEWNQRKTIISGLAAALFYLHEQLDTQIIHRDVKSSNVMLDSQFNARLGDFGLARWVEHTSELNTPSMRSNSANIFQFRLTNTSRIGGTIGYLPPESFQRKGSATAKSDVFSFGIVVLELTTGRRAVDLTYPDDQIFMLDWVRRLSDEGKLLNAGDNKLPDGSYPLSELSQLVHLGLLCSLYDPRSRPTMKWVMENLSDNNLGNLPSLPSFKSLPKYISLSSTSTTTTGTTTGNFSNSKSIYVTAADSTIFVTAEHGDTGSGRSSGISRNSQQSFKSINAMSNIDTPRQISYKEIVVITNNFSESQMVAELDFGSGYEGYLDNKHVLVKRLGMKTCPALRTRFSNELSNLARLRHRNLVQLRGWCTEQGEMLVVYDYSTTRLLSNYLFLRRNYVLPWHHRYNIIKSLASAVLYLHEEWEEKVIHQNITSSAVFLDHDMNPRLGSFALAEFLSRNEHGHHIVSNPARGIFGYMSPEYIEYGDATTMADVYSFGVVVLEMVSGVAAVDFRFSDVLLVKRVHNFQLIDRPLMELVDQRLDKQFEKKEMNRLLKLGVACTKLDPNSRPSMRQIVSILDGNDEILDKIDDKKEERDYWEEKNEASLSLVRRIKALGIH